MTKENEQPTQDMATKINPERICDYQQTSTVNTGENNNKNYMNIQNENPVTAQAEQVTAYVADNENENLIINNLKDEKNMKEETLKTAEEMVNTTNSNNVDSNGNLLDDIINSCKEAEAKIVNGLEADGLAGTAIGISLINLTGAYRANKIKIARLRMNRKPNIKAIKALKESLKKYGQQIMLLLIPATIAKDMGFDIEDFNSNEIPEEELIMTVVVIDGQTRLQAYWDAIAEEPNSSICDLYAYFPLRWIPLDEMLKLINLKVFSWKNSDFMTGVISNKAITDKTKQALGFIQKLESEGYNYTAACEFVTMNKGIIRKTPLVKAMSSNNSILEFDKAEFGIAICKAAKKKFAGKNESAIKNKTIPELIIDKWNIACKELSQKEAKSYIIAFIDQIDSNTLTELVSPSGYERGKGKKKDEFIKEHFIIAFKNFQTSHPYSEFKDK